MTKAIILDLGNVIVRVDVTRLYSTLARIRAFPPGEVPRLAASTGLIRDYEMGHITSGRFAEQLCQKLGLQLSYSDFCEIWNSVLLPDPLVPEELLQALRARYRLLLLSNTNALHFEAVLARYPLMAQFHDFVLSYEVGAMKPEERIYQEAVARAGCRPHECFFTDDSADNVEAARRQGIDAVQFHSLEQLNSELRARGIA